MIDRIVAAIDPRPGDALVEIGPGRGALTRPAARSAASALTVVELDRDLAARLRRNAGARGRRGRRARRSISRRSPRAAAGRKLRVVGNLPYNISTPILFHLLEASRRDRRPALHAAEGGGRPDRRLARHKDYGRLTVMLQWRYEIEPLLDVPPEAFEPPPRVDSAVLRMTPLPLPRDVDPALLRELVTVGFSQRRKLLRHTVGRWLDARGADQPFDLQRRAEEVPVDEWIALAAALKKTTPEGSAPPSRREGSAAGREQP